MIGRDPREAGRAATSLELLFDLTFVTALSVAASKFQLALAAGQFGPALVGFAFASFAICWAWMNVSWFDSAFDTDDWIFRLATLAQMLGVLVLGIGLPALFTSLQTDGPLNYGVMVLGYVVLRCAMVFQWLRAARQDPANRRTCGTYAALTAAAQLGWVTLVLLDLSSPYEGAAISLLVIAEICIPFIGERSNGGTPWHACHIAERHSLFAIIAMGEGVVGAGAALSAVLERQGWTADAAMVGLAGAGLTFGVWWIYGIIPSGLVLQARRGRALLWALGQMVLVTAIVATGAGLHVAAAFLERQAVIGPEATVLCVAIPLAVCVGAVYALYGYLIAHFDRFHLWLMLGTAGVIATAAVASGLGLGMPACLIILMLAPAVTVLGYEVLGHRHERDALARITVGAAH